MLTILWAGTCCVPCAVITQNFYWRLRGSQNAFVAAEGQPALIKPEPVRNVVPSPLIPAPSSVPPLPLQSVVHERALKQSGPVQPVSPQPTAPELFSLVESADRRDRGGSGEPIAPQKSASPAGPEPRRVAYGMDGVMALIAEGAVVFDRKLQTQRLVKPGSRLPNGSLLKEVNAAEGRVRTDRGDLIFDDNR